MPKFYGFSGGPEGAVASDAEWYADALASPMSVSGTLGESGINVALSTYGFGTAIKETFIPRGQTELSLTSQASDVVGAAVGMPFGSWVREGVQYLINDPDSPTMTEEQVKASRYYRGDPYEPGMTEQRLAVKADWKDTKAVREHFAQLRPISAFIGGLAGQAVDPINYIPIAGPLVKGAAIARFGHVVGEGLTASIDAAANTAVFGAATAPARARYGDDVSFQAQISQIASAAMIGAAFGSIGGVFGARRAAREEAKAAAKAKAAAADAKVSEDFATELAKEPLGRTPDQQAAFEDRLNADIGNELSRYSLVQTTHEALDEPPPPPGVDDRVFNIVQNGETVGRANIRVNGTTAEVRDIYSLKGDKVIGSNSFGPAAVRQLMRQFLAENPEIKNFTGERVSGARMGGEHKLAGEGIDVSIQLPLKDVIRARIPVNEGLGSMINGDDLKLSPNATDPIVAHAEQRMANGEWVPTTGYYEVPGAVGREVMNRMAAAGRPHEEAAAAGQLWDSWYASQAKQLGVPVEQLVERVGLPEVRAGELQAAGGQTLHQGAADLPARIDKFENAVKAELGLKFLSLSLTNNNSDLRLHMIAVERGEMGKGKGTAAMQRIVDFADENGLRITLTAGVRDDKFGTTSQSRLTKFYKRFGFVENKGRNKDFSITATMYRRPTPRAGGQEAVTLFQPSRGAIQFGTDGKTVISLFANADASTAIHESGHFFLQAFKQLAEHENAPAAIKADWKQVKAWWRVNAEAVAADSGKADVTAADVHAVLDNGTTGDRIKDLAIDVGLHEQYARAFELYAREGKAPTEGLRKVFDQFKEWLTKIYRQAKDLNVNLTPEVRAVFDNMLGGEKQRVIDTRTTARPTPEPRGFKEAAAALTKTDTARDVAAQYGIDLASGHFPEMDDIDMLRKMGRLTADDEAELKLAEEEAAKDDAYGTALKAALRCEFA